METMKTQLPFLNEKPIFKKVADVASMAAMHSDELQSYMDSVDAYRTTMAAFAFSEMRGEERGRADGIAIGEKRGIAIGEKRGRADGIAIGEERGRAEEREKAYQDKLDSARSLKALGTLTISQIAMALGLSEDEVANA